MGCATTICTDKTGTLTTNKMTARSLFVHPSRYAPGVSGSLAGEVLGGRAGGAEAPVLKLIKEAISVNTLDVSTPTSGNPTESALLKLVEDLRSDFKAIRRESMRDVPVAKQFIFTSDRKVMR